MYNTLAEIQRNCNDITDKVVWNFVNPQLAISAPEEDMRVVQKLEHPTKGFHIWSDETYYIVIDRDRAKLYKLRT